MHMKNQKLETVVEIPEGITARVQKMTVEVEGKGKKNVKTFTAKGLSLEVHGQQFKIIAPRMDKKSVRFSNTIQAHIQNMIQGIW